MRQTEHEEELLEWLHSAAGSKVTVRRGDARCTVPSRLRRAELHERQIVHPCPAQRHVAGEGSRWLQRSIACVAGFGGWRHDVVGSEVRGPSGVRGSAVWLLWAESLPA